MHCPKCGTENPDGAQTCNACGCVFKNDTAEKPLAKPKTSRLAIASLVLGILSIFALLFTAIPAVGLGIMSLLRIKKSSGQLKGKGLAIAGIAIAVAITSLWILMMPTLMGVKTLAHRLACGQNMSTLGKAMLIYANEHDDMFPTPSKWCDLLIEHCDVSKKQFRCKGASQGPCNYAMNKNIEKLGSRAPPDMVLLFETYPGWNQSGGPEILSTENHNNEGCNILFVDSHVQFVRTKDLNDLKWTADKELSDE